MAYLGHRDDLTALQGIYPVCTHVVASLDLEPRTILDLGARHGEGFLEFGIGFPSAKYIFVEPSPRCIPIIQRLIANHPDYDLELVGGILGESEGRTDFHLLESDGDQSANLFSNRGGRYGSEEIVQVPVIAYDRILEPSIDFAKINIEGGEYALLHSQLFQRISVFVMEAHNQHVPGKTYKTVLKELEHDYDLQTFGNRLYKYCFIFGQRRP